MYEVFLQHVLHLHQSTRWRAAALQNRVRRVQESSENLVALLERTNHTTRAADGEDYLDTAVVGESSGIHAVICDRRQERHRASARAELWLEHALDREWFPTHLVPRIKALGKAISQLIARDLSSAREEHRSLLFIEPAIRKA